MQSIFEFFSSAHLSPHGFCLLWRPDLLRLHVVSDALIGLAYFSIPMSLIVLIRRRTDLQFGWIFWLLPAFILSCGITHWFAVWTIWHPDYALEGLVKAFTAAISLLTAFAFWPLMPKLIAAPGLAQMTGVNTALQAEIRDRILLETKLTALNAELEARVAARTAELTTLNQALQKGEDRFRQVVEAAPNAMLMVDPAGRIVMVNKQAEMVFGCDRSDLLGKPVENLLPAPLRDGHQQLRNGFFAAPESRPMGAGRDLHGLRQDGTTFPVEIGLNPIETEEGTMVLSAIVDISDRKHREERINAALKEKDVLLAEIHHRVKNNLQVITSMLNMQQRGLTDVSARGAISDTRQRIGALALIYRALYQGPDLKRVDLRQFLEELTAQIIATEVDNSAPVRTDFKADELVVDPDRLAPIALFAVEAISNALKHGLGPEGGVLSVRFMLVGDEGRLEISDNGGRGGSPEVTEGVSRTLMIAFARQLRGRCDISQNLRGGMTARLTFPVPVNKAQQGRENKGNEAA